jgi:hypothetical protein
MLVNSQYGSAVAEISYSNKNEETDNLAYNLYETKKSPHSVTKQFLPKICAEAPLFSI